MGAIVEPMVQKEAVLQLAANDQYRGSYTAFGEIHWPSLLLDCVMGALAVYAVWFVQYQL